VTKCDPKSGDGCVFVEYINTFLKLKTEASGYPSLVQCPEDEDRYISEFHKSEGIQLEKDYRTKPCETWPNQAV
jgi:hypothetical protein